MENHFYDYSGGLRTKLMLSLKLLSFISSFKKTKNKKNGAK